MRKNVKTTIIRLAVFLLLFSFFFWLRLTASTSDANNFLYHTGEGGSVHTVVLKAQEGGADLFYTLTPEIEKYNGNMYATISGEDDDKLIKYMYITNDSLLGDIKTSSGRFLCAGDENGNIFISNVSTGSGDQIGKIETLTNSSVYEFRVMDPEKMTSGFFKRHVTLVFQSQADYDNFIRDISEEGISAEELDYGDMDEAPYPYKIIIPAILLVICAFLSFYEILNMHKDFAVRKLMGQTMPQMFFTWQKKTLLSAAAAIAVSVVAMSFILRVNFNSAYLTFLKSLCPYYILAVALLCAATSLPFLYVRSIKAVDLLKNRKPTDAISSMNIFFKTAVSVVVVCLLVIAIENGSSILAFFDSRYSKWLETKKYFEVTDFCSTSLTVPETTTEDYNTYLEFNADGAVLADFDEYSDYVYWDNLELNDNCEYMAATATVNPNYLLANEVLDTDGNVVTVSESEKNIVALFPEKYRSEESDIKEYLTDRWDGKPCRIVWIKDGQQFFSYRIDIKPNNANYVTDAILTVLTTAASDESMLDYTAGYQGNPLKIDVSGYSEPYEKAVEDKLYKYFDQSYSFGIENTYQYVSAQVSEYRQQMLTALAVCLALMLVLASLIIEELYVFFSENKHRIVVMRLHGVSAFKRYRMFILGQIFAYAAITLFSMIFQFKWLTLIIIAVMAAINAAAAFIFIHFFEKKRIVSVLKCK